MRTLLVASQKGGVGTTATAVNLAAAAAAAGRRVLLFDADPRGGVAAALALDPPCPPDRVAGFGGVWAGASPGVDVACPYPADSTDPAADLATALAAVPWHAPRRYDVVVIDGPAGLGHGVEALLAVADELVVVQRADAGSFRTLAGFLGRVRAARDGGARVRLRGVLMTLPAGVRPGGQTEATLRAKFRGLLPAAVPFDPAVGRCGVRGRAVVAAAPDSPAGRAYTALADRLGLTAPDPDDDPAGGPDPDPHAGPVTALMARPVPAKAAAKHGADESDIFHVPKPSAAAPARRPAGQTMTLYLNRPPVGTGPDLLAAGPVRRGWAARLLGLLTGG